MKNNFLPICLQGNYRDSLGEFGNKWHGMFGAERVNSNLHCFVLLHVYIHVQNILFTLQNNYPAQGETPPI